MKFYLPWPGKSWQHDGYWSCNADWGFFRVTRPNRYRWLGYLSALWGVVVYRLTNGYMRRHHPNGGIYPWWYELLMGELRFAWLSFREGRWT